MAARIDFRCRDRADAVWSDHPFGDMPMPLPPTDDLPAASRGAPLASTTPEDRTSRTAPLPPAFGPYRLLRVLGEGGMGVVYLAEQERPRRFVALKVMKPGTATRDRLRRFEHEANVLARLQHPGIAQIFDAGYADAGFGPQPFFVMELVEGRTLTDFARENNLRTRDRLELMVQVCQAIQHAHQKGVIHRDLKPGNILVDASGRPRVLDFGVARLTDADIHLTMPGTSVGQLVGTLPYMSPEQVAADPAELDTRSDIYTLGVICYQLLTDRLPHDIQGKSPLEAARVIGAEEPTPLSAANPVFRGDLDTIVATALERDKTRRYQTAADLAADLTRYLRDEPIVARPPSALYQFRKFAKRNKALVAACFTVVVALVMGSWLWARAVVQRERAEGAERERSKQVVEVHLQTADLAGQRGQWRKAIENYDRVLEKGAADVVGLRLKKARAFLAVNDLTAYEREVQALAARSDLGEHEGAVLLLRGDRALGVDNRAALQLISEALTKGLSKADEQYARALLARTSPEAVNLLRGAVECDPTSPRLRSMLALTLLLLGRFGDSRAQLAGAVALFPEEPNFLVYTALLDALEGNRTAAQANLARARGQLGKDEREVLESILDSIANVCREAALSDQEVFKMVEQLFAMMPKVYKIWLSPGTVRGEADVAAGLRLLPLPPALLQSYGHLQASLQPLAQEKSDQKAIEELKRAVAIHPEGSLQYLLASMYFGKSNYVEAEHAAMTAAGMPSLFPIRRGALFLAAACEGLLGSPRRRDGPPDLAMRRKAVENLHLVLAQGSPQPHEYRILTKIANNADEIGLARGLLDGWERQEPEAVEVHRIRFEVEMKAGNYGKARESALQGQRMRPGDSGWSERLKDATDRLRQQAAALDKP
jgi:tetratricopeptide (TPR) repeat protein/predicted Ser/Thr protein kinase